MAVSGRLRFRTIDGLRGLAALSVVIYHLHGQVAFTARDWLPHWLTAVMQRSFVGVDVFFVISGFVIAYSVREGSYTWKYLAAFASRRAIRLDPPYWIAIFLELLLMVAGIWLFPELTTVMPSVRQIASHLIYAQNVLGFGDIVSVFWTLCYEVQFYLFFVVLLMAWQAVRPRVGERLRRFGPMLVLGALVLVSLLLRFGPLTLPIPGIALLRWYQFFMGVLAWWIVAGRASMWAMVLMWLAVAVSVGAAGWDPVNDLVLPVSGFVLLIARLRRLETTLASRPLQFLGTISYSLYLFHLPVGGRFVKVLQRLIGHDMSPAVAWVVFLAGIAVSIMTAAVAWWALERPSIALSKRVRLPAREVPGRIECDVPSGFAPAGGMPVGVLDLPSRDST